MENSELPEQFQEFLQLLNENNVKYLLIGGYAVGYYGYPRTTADMDVWIEASHGNALNLQSCFESFGLPKESVPIELILETGNILRMGIAPMRIEVLNEIDGVDFAGAYEQRENVLLDSIEVPLISLPDLRKNKKASGRHKDLDDLEHLPEA